MKLLLVKMNDSVRLLLLTDRQPGSVFRYEYCSEQVNSAVKREVQV